MAGTSINLISTQAGQGPEFGALAATLKKVCYGSVIIFLASGLIVGAAYAFVRIQIGRLNEEKSTFAQAISASSVKEGLLLSLKNRIAVMDKLATSEKHMDILFNRISEIGATAPIKSFTLDDKNQVTMITQVNAIEQGILVTDAVIKEALAGNLTKPSLVSMTLDKTGTYNLTVSFVANL